MDSDFDDVCEFHQKFGVRPDSPIPHLPPKDVWEFRLKFLKQELAELEKAYNENSLPDFADALVDLSYVVLGTAHLASLSWSSHWQEVHLANMAKQRVQNAEESLQLTGRGHSFDVIKPPGWTPPDHVAILRYHGWVPK